MSDYFENYTSIPTDYTGCCFIASLNEEHYYKNGVAHRTDGPAIRHNIWNGEYWYFQGRKHRLDGPAFIQHKNIIFSIHGKYYTKENFWNHPLVIKNILQMILSETD